MFYKLKGSYAPEKKDVRVGVYSLADLRRKMKEKGLQVTDNPHE
jgi:hypothetical protein